MLPRDDYRELLELTIIFLGNKLPKGETSFKAPGATHHARWMAKAIYALKIFMFRTQFNLKASEINGLRDVCIFIIRAYIKQWFTAGDPVSAPANDIRFLCDLNSLVEDSQKTVVAAKNKFLKHLWYLSEELVGFSFFDENVSSVTKRKMVEGLNKRTGSLKNIKNRTLSKTDFTSLTLDKLVTKNTNVFFEYLKIPISFLREDPENWPNNKDYIKGKSIVNSIKVTNDNAERGVALVQEFNKFSTKDEDQFQYLLQVVNAHRRLYPDINKKTLKNPFIL